MGIRIRKIKKINKFYDWQKYSCQIKRFNQINVKIEDFVETNINLKNLENKIRHVFTRAITAIERQN